MKNTKTIILDKIIEELRIQVKNAEDGRTHNLDESKAHKGAMVSRYDTFKEEAQNLAIGYSLLLVKLNQSIGILNSIKSHPPNINGKGSSYSLIEAKNLDNELIEKYFLLPAGGGNIYDLGEGKITVINVSAPMARVFIGTTSGDEVKFKIKNNVKRFKILSIT